MGITKACTVAFLAAVVWVGCASRSPDPVLEDGIPRASDPASVLPPSFPPEEFGAGWGAAAEAEADYRVGPRDVLSITVYGEADLSVPAMMVSSDGYISVPLVGRVLVDDLTVRQIEERLTGLLSDGFLLHPQVMVSVTSFVSRSVIILGAVEQPGSYPLTGRLSLLDLISQAGGIRSESAGSSILIWRNSPAEYAAERESDGALIRIQRERLLNQGDMRLNVPILDNDVVFLPEAEHIYIIGEVRQPGSFRIQRDRITALEAISMAGGFTSLAASNRTRIIRVEEGTERNIPVPVGDVIRGERSRDVVLMPGDVIVVPQSRF